MSRPHDAEVWRVDLVVDGVRRSVDVTIYPPFGIRRADAEVRAIRQAEASAQTSAPVRALACRFVRYTLNTNEEQRDQ